MNTASDAVDPILQLVCATANPGKVAELAGLLAPVAQLLERPDGIGEVDEVAETLEGNALLKATAIADSHHNTTGAAAIADDTGLEVVALGGAPGVRSARYGSDARDHGGGSDDAANRARLLAELAALGSGADRRARFRTVIAVVWPTPLAREPVLVEGICTGRIAEAEAGDGGFGYDSVFIPDDGSAGMTFAQMSFAAKQAISHRSRAIAALVEVLATRRDG